MLDSEVETEEDGETVRRVSGVFNAEVKEMLERICVPHKIVGDKIVISGDDAHVFAFCLGRHVSEPLSELNSSFNGSVLERCWGADGASGES